ncbi:hypothetical protein C1170_06390 [Stutzerimonas frequens]|uniref:Phage tail protein n=1 Tax=Stutzerimonas frequens TaxID=2968969 RepID=A0ABX6XYA2_9GAMM|nr:phage tail protein [Stutzerimonas frequens]PNF52560.1 hypothetical protein C1170_06390 [Stutzerimonas frequens]QPT19041.1 phage tail protein [Stutzerimonas frequens]
MPLNITITDAGRAEIINAQNTGTGPVVISEVGVGTGQYTPDKEQLTLQAEVKRLATIAGLAVADDTIHVMIKDEGADAYNVGEFGLYSSSGTLIAVYSQLAAAGWIIQKAGASTLLLATDIILESLDATSLTFGDITFINPPATTEVQGVVELATALETQTGTDGARAVTPAGLASLTASLVRAGLVQLVNTLTSSSQTQALTAAMGKKLQDEKQPLDATLTALAGLVTAANKLIYATGADTFATTDLTAFARTLLGDASAAEARTTLGAQPLDATLTALAGLATTANKLIYATGSDTFATSDLTAFARTLLGDANAAAALATLGAAPLNSPGLTGVPTGPTAALGTDNTQLATTAFIQAALTAIGLGAVAVNVGTSDLDTVLTTSISFFSGAANAPFGNNGVLLTIKGNTSNYLQVAWRTTSNVMFMRTKGTGAWNDWSEVYNSSTIVNAFTYSFGTSGRIRLPSGFLFQWTTLSGNATSGTWTFPLAFPNECFGVQITDRSVGNGSAVQAFGHDTPSKTGVTYYANSDTAVSLAASAWAIGN